MRAIQITLYRYRRRDWPDKPRRGISHTYYDHPGGLWCIHVGPYAIEIEP